MVHFNCFFYQQGANLIRQLLFFLFRISNPSILNKRFFFIHYLHEDEVASEADLDGLADPVEVKPVLEQLKVVGGQHRVPYGRRLGAHAGQAAVRVLEAHLQLHEAEHLLLAQHQVDGAR